MVNPRDVAPTRAELLALRKRFILVEHGHRVLKMKQDVLLLELSRLIAEVRTRRQAVSASYARARRSISIAQMMEGSVGILIAALSVEESAAGLLHVIDRLTPDDSGSFLDWQGQSLPW